MLLWPKGAPGLSADQPVARGLFLQFLLGWGRIKFVKLPSGSIKSADAPKPFGSALRISIISRGGFKAPDPRATLGISLH